MLYFCKGGNLVVAVHADDQIWLDPIATYGTGAYVVADYKGPAPKTDPPMGGVPPISTTGAPMPPPFGQYVYPTITAKMQADSVKLECRRRITLKVSEQAQRNITTHINDIQMARMTQAPARVPTPAEQADMDAAAAIWNWIGRPSGMQAASDAMITANDLEWYQDVKWPPWNGAWDSFVVRF
jgi:hypothetical protein